MSQNETINTPQDYVNYTFNIEARGVAEVSSELMGLSNTVSNILGQIAFKTSEFLTHTESMAIGAGVAVSALYASATKDAINFQQQIANVQAIGGESLNAQAIGNAAMEYSNKFGMATASMTEGLEALARAGITTTSVMQGVLEEGVKLSKLEGMDLEDSINDLISTTNLLALEDVDMNDAQYAEMVKQMNQHIVSTSESAPINAQNIIQSLQHVGGYASAGGMDQDDLFAVIAQLGARGTKGEMAGTALRAFIAAGQKDTAQRALARVGLNVSDLWNDNGETMLSISEMKNVLDQAMEKRGYSKQEKLEFYSDFAGYKQANQIMKIDTSEVEHYKEQIANAWDLGKKLDTILGTVRGNLDRIKQITTNFMTKVGSKFLTILSAILTPLRIGLELFTKIPFMDTAFAVGMIFIGFKTGLSIFNKLVPALSGFMSGLNKIKGNSRGIRGEWEKTREEIQKTKDIISLIKAGDQAGLAKMHYDEHGLSAKNKDAATRDIVGQMYMASDWYHEHGRIPWHNLSMPMQDMIIERLKPTEAFETNYDYYVEQTKKFVNEIIANPVDLTNISPESEPIEAINVTVGEIFNLLKTDRTRGAQDGPTSNRESNKQANFVSKIMRQYGIEFSRYGNYSFKYQNEDDIDELKERTQNTILRVERQAKDYSNTDYSTINTAQKELYRKQLYKTDEENQVRKKYSLESHESEIRFLLEKGQFTDINKWSTDTYRQQLALIGDSLHLSTVGIENASQEQLSNFASQIYDTINNMEDKVSKINEITNITNQAWDTHLDTTQFNFLKNNNNMAQEIASQLSINQGNHQTIADAIIDFFNQDSNRTNENFDKAIQIMFEQSHANNSQGELEQNSLRFTLENLQRERNTFQSYINQGIGDAAVQEELSRIIERLDANNILFRTGGKELGAAFVEGFVRKGLGIHSPGYSARAFAEENERIKNTANNNIDEMRNIGFKLGKALSQGTIDGLTEKNINKIWDNAYDGTKDSVLNKIKQQELQDPLIQENANVFYNSWGDKRFNAHINEYLRRETPNFNLKDEMGYISPEMDKLLEEYNIETISYLSTILGQTLLKTSGLPFNLKLFRQGRIQTADNGFGILTGVTSTAYDPDLTKSYKSSGNELLEILAPKGTQGMNLFDWEYTLAPNTPYIELGKTEEDATRILLLPPKQQQKYSFYPEGLDDSFRISPSAAIANTGWVDSDIGYDVDGVTFDDFLYDNENIARVISTDGYHYFDNDEENLLTSGHRFDFANEIDAELISANNAILDNFTPLTNSSLYLAQEIVSNFVHKGLGRHSPGLIVAAMMAEGYDLHEAIEEIKKVAKKDGIELGQNFAQSAIQEIEQLTDTVRNLFVNQKDKLRNKANTPIGYIRGVGEKQVQLGQKESWGIVPAGKYSYEDIVTKGASNYGTSIVRRFKPDRMLGDIPIYSKETHAKAEQIMYDSTLDDFIRYIAQSYEISSNNQYRDKKQSTPIASKYRWRKYNQYVNHDMVGLSAKDMLALDPKSNGISGIHIDSEWLDKLKNWNELSEWVNDDDFTDPTALMYGLVGTSAENQKIFEISKQNLTKHILKKIPPEVGKNAVEANAGGANWNKVNGDLEKAINNRYSRVTKEYDEDFYGNIPFIKLTDLYKQQHDTSYKIHQNTSSKNEEYSDMSNEEKYNATWGMRQANYDRSSFLTPVEYLALKENLWKHETKGMLDTDVFQKNSKWFEKYDSLYDHESVINRIADDPKYKDKKIITYNSDVEDDYYNKNFSGKFSDNFITFTPKQALEDINQGIISPSDLMIHNGIDNNMPDLKNINTEDEIIQFIKDAASNTGMFENDDIRRKKAFKANYLRQPQIDEITQKYLNDKTLDENIPWSMPGLHFDTFSSFNMGKQQFNKDKNIKEEFIKQFYNAIDNDDINLFEESLNKLTMIDEEFASYRTVLNRINNLDERKGLLQNNVKTLKSLLVPDIRNTNGTSIIGSGLFLDDNKLEAYREKIKKENIYKKSIKKDIGEDTQQTVNSQFVITPEIRDFINNQQTTTNGSKTARQKEDTRNQQRADEEYMKWYKEEKKRKEKLINDSTEAYTKQQDNIKRQKEIANLRKQMAEDEERWGKEGIEYAAQKRKQLKELREKQKLTLQIQKEMVNGTLEHLQNLQGRGGINDAPEDVIEEQKEKEKKKVKDIDYDDDYIARILGIVQSKYGDSAPDMDNKFNVARILVGFTGDHRNIVSGIDFAEKIHDKTKNIQNDFITSAAERVTKNQDTEKTQLYADAVGSMKTKLESATKMMYGFRNGLDKVSEVFPPLTIAVWAVDGAIQAAEAATWLLSIAHDILTGSEMFDQLATWGLITSKQAEALSEIAAAGATWLLNGALIVLDALIGPLGIILLGIAAAIAVVKFWETEHAKALEASRKELEENTARNNIAVSQYKDLKKARENETDAIKKQQAARKEAIALYELEASRIKKQKSIQEEAKLRNDTIWGEYGLRAQLQKMGLGIIAGGDFESQYQNYEGTTGNIRQIRESTLGSVATPEQSYVSAVYDKNSMFFAQVEGNKEPLQELYDKESSLIEKYGSVEAARGSKEFADAVKEFSDATGINGKTAGMMLDWLETENRVSQATKIGQAEIGMIQAQTQAKVMAIDAEGEYGLGDMNNLGDAMIVAQFQEMMNTAKTEMWWDLLFAYMNLILSALSPWDWFTGETAKNQKKVAAYQEGLNELDAQGNQILQDMLDSEAERNDYGTGSLSNYHDSPFGGALASAGMSQAPTTGNNNVMQTMSQTTDTSQVYDNFQESVKEAPKIEQANVPTTPTQQTNQQSTGKTSTTVVHIHNININTEDDPEKIKSALMNLIIEMQEQVVPRTVSRTIGQSPTQSTSMTQNPNDSTQVEGTDTQSGIITNNNNGNQNPTV